MPKQNSLFKKIFLATFFSLFFAINFTNAEWQSSNVFCYPTACIDLSREQGGSRNLVNTMPTLEEFFKNLREHYSHGGVSDSKDSQGRIIGIACGNGAGITVTYKGCANGATNEPTCNVCPAGANMVNGQCVCSNGATGSQCNICPAGQVMTNNLCVCANGATNPTACNICPAGSNMINGQCSCNNGADVFMQCNSCKNGQVMDNNGQCKDGCSTTNACGQTIQGFMNNGQCQLSTVAGADPNASCILNFNVTTNTVNPNGSVEFSWALAPLPNGVSSRCGFVDLTTPTPRPIPGLQDLNPQTDRIRINNVQATTRFCLVCQFYNLLQNNTLLGEAAKHQWVRVIRVGEN